MMTFDLGAAENLWFRIGKSQTKKRFEENRGGNKKKSAKLFMKIYFK